MPCCKFTAEFSGERIFEIAQHFLKLRTNIVWHIFMPRDVLNYALDLVIYALDLVKHALDLSFMPSI